MKDRVIGYIVIAILICFLIIPILYLRWKTAEPVINRTIAFSHVRSLSLLAIDDPVRLRGVEIGRVRAITSKNDTVFAMIETHDNISIYENYSIRIVAKGVMGDRYLTIMPGDAGQSIVKPATLLNGTVNMSPDDALSYIRDLQKAIHTLVVLSGELKNGTDRKQSLITRIRQFTSDIDSVVTSMNTLIANFDTTFSTGLADAAAGLDTLQRVILKTSTELPEVIALLSSMIGTLEQIVPKVDSVLGGLDTLVDNIADPELALWKKSTTSIENDLTELRKLLRSIQYDTLILPVRLW